MDLSISPKNTKASKRSHDLLEAILFHPFPNLLSYIAPEGKRLTAKVDDI
jgi:hypothetical protein